VPLDTLAQLERPHPEIGARLPRFGEVALESQVTDAARLIGEHIADETAAGEGGELEEPDRLRQSRVQHRRVPRGGSREGPAPLGRFRTHRDPVWIRRRRLREGLHPAARHGEHRHAGGAPPRTSEKLPAIQRIADWQVTTDRHVGSPSFWRDSVKERAIRGEGFHEPEGKSSGIRQEFVSGTGSPPPRGPYAPLNDDRRVSWLDSTHARWIMV
jgi:hypothetical protein